MTITMTRTAASDPLGPVTRGRSALPVPARIAAELRAAIEVAARHDGAVPLADALYAQWYARPVPSPAQPAEVLVGHRPSTGPSPSGPGLSRQERDSTPLPGPPLAGALRAAHPGAGRWTPAVVRSVDPRGAVVVQLEGRGPHRVVLPGDLTQVDPAGRGGLAPRPGDDVLVSSRHGALTVSGWWRTWSADWSLGSPPPGLTRVYLCTARRHQVRAVGAVLRLLDRTDAPWLLKTAVHAVLQDRPDRTVVYLPDASAPDLLAALRPVVGHLLDPHRPPLTAEAGPGIGWAQDDGAGPSFGESRCALLAHALAGPADDPDHLVERVAAVLARVGLDPSRPHLRASEAAI